MLDMGEPLKIVDLARDLIRLSQHTESDIPIVFTGLRPGEKIFEETHMQGESIHPTGHPQIVVTEAVQPHQKMVADWLAGADSVHGGEVAVRWLRQLVPEYSPNGVNVEVEPLPPEPRQGDLGFVFSAVIPVRPRIVM
jgi:FlaA1/EpsC-like NDP-sugar epimerase